MENYSIHTSNLPYLPSTWRKWFDSVIAGYGEEKGEAAGRAVVGVGTQILVYICARVKLY